MLGGLVLVLESCRLWVWRTSKEAEQSLAVRGSQIETYECATRTMKECNKSKTCLNFLPHGPGHLCSGFPPEKFFSWAEELLSLSQCPLSFSFRDCWLWGLHRRSQKDSDCQSPVMPMTHPTSKRLGGLVECWIPLFFQTGPCAPPRPLISARSPVEQSGLIVPLTTPEPSFPTVGSLKPIRTTATRTRSQISTFKLQVRLTHRLVLLSPCFVWMYRMGFAQPRFVSKLGFQTISSGMEVSGASIQQA